MGELISEFIGAAFVAVFLILVVICAMQVPNLPTDHERN